MITIKKAGRVMTIPQNDFLTSQDTSDGMYFKFKDGSEYRIYVDVTPLIKTISRVLEGSTAKDIIIDFDQRNPITISG